MGWRQVACDREIHGTGSGGILLCRDARSDFSDYAGQVQCVYMDPPFMTGEDFHMRVHVGAAAWRSGKANLVLPAYTDKYADRSAFLCMLRSALENAWSMLCDTGSLFLHLDPRMAAYSRVLCDELFGEECFRNEIIWAYQSGGRSTKKFSSKHDVILYYAKNKASYFDMTAIPIPRSSNRRNHMRRSVDENGRSYRSIVSGGKTYVYYDDDPVYPGDVWTDVSHLQQKDPQRTGYDTQKPLELLNRIILCSTKPGDLVADLFMGSGTTCVSAALNGRRFLGNDCGMLAVGVTRKRMLDRDWVLDVPCSMNAVTANITRYPGLAFSDVTLNGFSLPQEGAVSGMDAVDQWSVGLYRDGTFFVQQSAARQKQTPEFPDYLQLKLLNGTPAVMIQDVYGNRYCFAEESDAD